MKIAWFSPFSRNSAIGAFSAAIVKVLSTMADVSVFASDLENIKEAWYPHKPIHFLSRMDMEELPQLLTEYDVCIYNLGDNLNFHRDIYYTSTRHPGIVILHDLVMHHFFSGYYFIQLKDHAGYVHALEFSHEDAGRQFGEQVVQGKAGDIWMTPLMLEYHMAKLAIHGAYGTIVHSQFALRALSTFSESPLALIQFPLFGVSERAHHGENLVVSPPQSTKIRILTYGHINSNKMACEVIESIGQSPLLREKALYLVVGSPAPGELEKMQVLISNYELKEQVQILPGWRSDQELHECLLQADIVMSLRNPHFGETSSVLHESMVMGKATVTWKHGSYDEVPDDSVVKVSNLLELKLALENLVSDGPFRNSLGDRAREYALRTFDTHQYCISLLAFAESVLYNKPIFQMADYVATSLVDLGAGPKDLVSQKIIREIIKLAGIK